jgi:hypothetical protein
MTEPDARLNMASQECACSGIEQLMNSEDCKIPYSSNVSYEEHEKIRLRIETFLLKNGIVSSDRLSEIHRQHLSPNEWGVIKETPERYWPNLFASRMNSEERGKVDKGGFIKQTYSRADSKKRYYVSSLVWVGVAEYFYFQSHGSLPPAEEEEAIIDKCTGPYHRCFFILAENVAEVPVTYSWSQSFLDGWRNFCQQYEREHPKSNKSWEPAIA